MNATDSDCSQPSPVRGEQLATFAIAAVLVAHLALSLLYNASSPIFEAPDEIWHYLYVRHIASGGGLPLQGIRNKNLLDQQEADQPPLFYVTAAALTFWAPRGDIQAIVRPNPMGSIGDPRTDGNKNRFVHGESEKFPWRGEVWTVHLVRFVSSLYGLLTILATYLLAREIWPHRFDVAIGSAAVVAFIPQFLYMDSAVSNDVAAAATSALVLLLSVRLLRLGPSRRRLILTGCMVSFCVLAKFGNLAAIALPALALAWWYYQRRDWQNNVLPFLRDCVTVLAVVIALTGWWFARNVILYGDAMPLKSFLGRTSLDDQIPTVSQFISDLPGLWMSSWALFGWFSILVSPHLYVFFTVVGLIGFVGLGVALIRWRTRQYEIPVALVLPALWCLVVLAALFRYRLMVAAFQGRLLFPAISAFAVLLFAGFAAYFPRRLGWLPVLFIVGSLLPVAATLPGQAIQPAYAPPPIFTASTLGRPSHSALIDFGGDMKLLGYDVSDNTLRPGGSLTVTLYWLAQRKMSRDYVVFIHVRDREGHILAQRDTFPGSGSFATTLWQPGEALRDPITLEVPPTVAVPTEGFLYVGLYDPKTKGRISARAEDSPIDANAAQIGSVRLVGPVPTSVPNPSDYQFGNEIAMVGYRIDQQVAWPGGTIHGQLYFRDLAPVSRDYTIFVHLTREPEVNAASILAQQDSQPASGNFPTTIWRPGDVVVHDFTLVIRPDTPTGRFPIRVGMYDLKTGRRLPTSSGDEVVVGRVSIR